MRIPVCKRAIGTLGDALGTAPRSFDRQLFANAFGTGQLCEGAKTCETQGSAIRREVNLVGKRNQLLKIFDRKRLRTL